jgi:CelD/BcsL family acetyltransferase involved in cellulose biosynthesis
VRNPLSAHAVRLSPQWDALYQQACSAKTRQTDRRKERRLADFGIVAFEPAVAPEDSGPALEALFELKSRRYRRTGARDIFARPGFAEFYAGLTRDGGSDPAVRLATLTVGGRIAAVHWGLVHRRRFYYLMPAFDEDAWGETSPGAVLYRRLLQWACEAGLDTFDFTIGDEPYKARWCDVTMPLWDHVAAHSVLGTTYVAQIAAIRTGRTLARRMPAVAECHRALKRVVRAIAAHRRQARAGTPP